MSDTNEMELAEQTADGQEPAGDTVDYDEATATPDWTSDQTQDWTGDQTQDWTTDQTQDWSGDAAQTQDWSSDQTQDWTTDQTQDWTGDAAQTQDWTGDAAQDAAMFAGGEVGGAAAWQGSGTSSQSPAAPGSSAIQVEFQSGPALSGNGMEIVIRNIGSSTIPKFAVLGTYAVYQREGLQVYPRDPQQPNDTLTHALDIPPGGSATVFIDLENIPGPTMRLPDGAYRARVHVGIVERELSFNKRMGKVEP
jgi:hypothetical protein